MPVLIFRGPFDDSEDEDSLDVEDVLAMVAGMGRMMDETVRREGRRLGAVVIEGEPCVPLPVPMIELWSN